MKLLKKFSYISKMKLHVNIVFLLIFLFSCSPIDSGVYFEFDGNKCTSEDAQQVFYTYGMDNSGGPKLNIYINKEDFIFQLTTFSLHKGYTYFNQVDANNNYAVVITVFLQTSKLGTIGTYVAKNDVGGYDNSLEIIRFDDQIFEAKFNVLMISSTGSNPSYKIKNGYIKVPL